MVEDLRQQLERLTSGRWSATRQQPAVRPPSPPIEELVGGEVANTAYGPCVLVDLTYPADYRHGHVDIAAALTHNPHTLATIGRDQVDVEKAVPFARSLKGMLPRAKRSA